MNRLTENKVYKDCEFMDSGIAEYMNKLAAYEDTGLRPEDFLILKNEVESYKEYYLNMKNLEEQGLLIKLPCKVGDTVYINKNCLNGWYCLLESKRYVRCEVIGVKKSKKQLLLNIKPLTERTANTRYHEFFLFSAIGKTIFLTQEEAEKALEAINETEQNTSD